MTWRSTQQKRFNTCYLKEYYRLISNLLNSKSIFPWMHSHICRISKNITSILTYIKLWKKSHSLTIMTLVFVNVLIYKVKYIILYALIIRSLPYVCQSLSITCNIWIWVIFLLLVNVFVDIKLFHYWSKHL